MGLIYGNTFLIKENEQERTDILSIVYKEYCNYNSLLESCISEDDKQLLEAKIEVLREVAIKDILEKIKKVWRDFKDWVKEKILAIIDKITGKNKEKDEFEDAFKDDGLNHFQPNHIELHKTRPDIDKMVKVKYYKYIKGELEYLDPLSSKTNAARKYTLWSNIINDHSSDVKKIYEDIDSIDLSSYKETINENLKKLEENLPEIETVEEEIKYADINDKIKEIEEINKKIEKIMHNSGFSKGVINSTISGYEQTIDEISKGINVIMTFTDQDNYKPDPSKCNKLISIINSDINTMRQVLSIYLKASINLQKYINTNKKVIHIINAK